MTINGMTGGEIRDILKTNKSTRKLLRGIWTRDKLKSETQLPGIWVVNTAKLGEAGEHWVLTYISPDDGTLYYFDSLGKPPQHWEIKEFIRRATSPPTGCSTAPRSRFYCGVQLQGESSMTCGLYCLYVAARLSQAVTMRQCTLPLSSTDHEGNNRGILELMLMEFPDIDKNTKMNLRDRFPSPHQSSLADFLAWLPSLFDDDKEAERCQPL